MNIYIDRGNGGFYVDDWTDLWVEMWRAVRYAICVQKNGHCDCGCEVKYCTYCVGECFNVVD